MFGYVTPNMRTLNTTARKEYRAYYCGICNTLRKRYGKRARFILNYDTAFLYIILDSLAKKEKHTFTRCPYHFGRRCECTKGEIADYVADVTVILSYLNLKDDVKDSNSLRAKFLLKLYHKPFKKAKRERKQLCEKIEAGLQELMQIEKSGETNADVPSGIFGDILGEVFAYNESAREFGYYLGKFIYLYDAVCDFKSDIKNKQYNPLILYRKHDFYTILTSVMGECCKKYKSLDIKMHDDIISNVLYDGIWLKYFMKYKFKDEKN